MKNTHDGCMQIVSRTMSTPMARDQAQRFLDMPSSQDSLHDDVAVEDLASPSQSPVKQQSKRSKQSARRPTSTSSSGSACSAPMAGSGGGGGRTAWHRPLVGNGGRTSSKRRKDQHPSPPAATNTSHSEQEIQQTAKRKVQYVSVSPRIQSHAQLFWHHGPDQNKEVYPCRTCERDEALGLPDIPETWDESRMVLVQYIVYPNVGRMRLVSWKQLTAYHGHTHKRKVQRANGTKVVGGGSWCENLMERYRKQRTRQLRNETNSSGGSMNRGKRKNKAKKGESGPMSQSDIQVDVLTQTLYLEKVLDCVRSQEPSSDESRDSGCGRSISDTNIDGASGRNWCSKVKKGDKTLEFRDEDKKDDSSSDNEVEEEEISWSQERNERLKSRQKKQATAGSRGKFSHKNALSSEDLSDENVEDDEGTEPTSFSQERDRRMKARKGAAIAATATPKTHELVLNSDSSSSSSDEELREQCTANQTSINPGSTRPLNGSVEKNESISVSCETSSDSESEDDTIPMEEKSLEKKRIMDRSSKGRVSFAGVPSPHDIDREDDASGSDDDEEVEDDEHEPLDIPYTQALGLESDDEYLPPPIIDPENVKSKEPIRPGDVIEYSSFLFVAGDKRGHREATVISVDPNRDPALVLDTGDILPNDTSIRRTKIIVSGKLRAHAGVSRPIQNYAMEKAVMKGRSDNVSAGFAKEASRVGSIIRRNMAKFQEKAQGDGFAPMDVMNKYKGTNFNSNDGSMNNHSGIRSKSGSLATKTSGLSTEGDRKSKAASDSLQSSVLSGSSSSESEEEQPRKCSAKIETTKQFASNKGNADALVSFHDDGDGNDDNDILFESESLCLPADSKCNGSRKGRDATLSPSSSSTDSENFWDHHGRWRSTKVESSSKHKSPDLKKAPKRDVWDTSPRKKKSSATTKTKRDSLSFESVDDDFEQKGQRRRMITVSDKEKMRRNQIQKGRSSNSPSKRRKKTKQGAPPSSSPIIDMTSFDEDNKGGWLSSLGGGTKTSKTPHATAATTATTTTRHKKEKAGIGVSFAGKGAAQPTLQSASAFSIRRFK